MLTHSGYEEIGKIEGALAQYADGVFEGLSNTEQEQARQIFVQLVQPGAGTEDTRRLAHKTDLSGLSWEFVQQLADERLVVTGEVKTGEQTETVVEITHEALIRRWGRLQGWLDEDRTFRLWQERLRVALSQWEENDYDNGSLLQSSPLAEAEGWLSQRKSHLAAQEYDFIVESRQVASRRRMAITIVTTAVIVVRLVHWPYSLLMR